MRRIVGVETEYGLIGRRRDASGAWRRLSPEDAADRLFAPLASEFATTNVFLPNGGRLYLDVGHHPEYATPECDSIPDLLTAERAGDEAMLALGARASALEASAGHETTFTFLKNNVDSFGNSYGSHENYLVARSTDMHLLSDWMVPFLVARQAIAGTGRWRRGEFTTSQRGDVFGSVVSHHSTRTRPLINVRDEPHADPHVHRRLHVTAGDSNLDEPTAWLRYGATELVLRLAESGRPAPLTLDDPLSALHDFGRDPDRAREILDVYRRAAEDVADGLEDVLAAWDADAVTPEWERKLDLIEAFRDRHGLANDDPQLDALDLRWHELGEEDGRPRGYARLLERRGQIPRLTSEDAVGAALQMAPSATRARLRGRLVEAIRVHGRSAAVDWASVRVHDLPANLRMDDPFADADPRVDVLVDRMATEPRRRLGSGFTPPA